MKPDRPQLRPGGAKTIAIEELKGKGPTKAEINADKATQKVDCNQSFHVEENKKIDISILYRNDLVFLHNYKCSDIELFRLNLCNDIEFLKKLIDTSTGNVLHNVLHNEIDKLRSTLYKLESAQDIVAEKERFSESVFLTIFISQFFKRAYCRDQLKCTQVMLNQIVSDSISSISAVYHNNSRQIYNNIIRNLRARLNYLERQLNYNTSNKHIEQLNYLTTLCNDLCILVQYHCVGGEGVPLRLR